MSPTARRGLALLLFAIYQQQRGAFLGEDSRLGAVYMGMSILVAAVGFCMMCVGQGEA